MYGSPHLSGNSTKQEILVQSVSNRSVMNCSVLHAYWFFFSTVFSDFVFICFQSVSVMFSSESLQTTVKPNKGSDVTVSSQQPDCTVCTISGVNDSQTSCQRSLKLEPEKEVKLLFRCPQPVEQSYNVTITSLIGKFKHNLSPEYIVNLFVLLVLSFLII